MMTGARIISEFSSVSVEAEEEAEEEEAADDAPVMRGMGECAGVVWRVEVGGCGCGGRMISEHGRGTAAQTERAEMGRRLMRLRASSARTGASDRSS